MANIHFYLKNRHASHATSIFMVVNYGDFQIINKQKKYKPLKYYIGENIKPIDWNTVTNRAKSVKSNPYYTLLNQRLSEIECVTHMILLELKMAGIVPKNSELKCILDERINKKISICNKTSYSMLNLFDFIAKFIKESENTRAAATILQYKNTLRLLRKYAAEVQNIDFQDIDLSFYASFKQYMNRAGYSETYFGNQIKFIRLFMNEATERGYNQQIGFKSRKFSSPQPLTTKVYLTGEEIKRIWALPLGMQKRLEASRDLFVLACKTGLRYSDLIQLRPENFSEEQKILRVQTKKTETIVHIPLSKDLLTLCEKYRFNLPKVNNTTFNQHIRQICRLAGVSEIVPLSVSKGNKNIQKLKPKYELVTAHTARRSFATNAFLAKVPSIAIMKITGHRTEEAFMKYIRITGEDNARQLLSHPYFS